ncbi:BLOC-1 related complex subunit 6 isoform X1 [Gadus chalcogrammus]|uniref:BLOC-1 related complex subunit 6 isoform X1 n=1 Tax=Gadus chalcogrammus TaxID=1042646 RepID=UPI0024C2C58C|nr:BLOC-1 related complex subunit 6 isoform X1 [Gadus chalcogrammus]XP_056453095.1 BLOC-1 related complex subunit 6 isoform X1 [Gadus chalcogrammus]XP_056453105.1 BLOC-1 related complex subunit 6 isoform X1 [Gadus chalcogrammus]
MSLFPAIGTELPDAANGVAAPVATQTFNDNGPHSHTQAPLRYGGGRVPHPGHRVEEEEEGSLGENHLHSETDQRSRTHSTDSKRHVKSSHKSRASKASLAAAATHTTDAGRHTQSSKARHTPEPPGAALRWAPVSAEETQSLGDDGEMEKQDGEEDEKERQWVGQHAEPGEELGSSRRYSSSAPGPSSCGSSSSARPPPPPPEESPCPPHVMAQVRVRNVPERERIVRGMQDSKSLDEISQACGGGLGSRGGGRGGQSEGRRATISSALELEGTVSHDGDLTHFITKNLEQKIKLSSKPSLDCSDSDCSGPILRSRGSARRPADIPPIDPAVLLDLERHTQEVARSVELMMRGLNGAIQNMTALSVGYIQTYRDSVDSLGESVDMSIKGMYTLMARCEELDRSMKPIHTLAAQIHDIKRTLDTLEAICK